MPERKFHFTLQPALDRAVAEEERCQLALAEMLRFVEEEKKRLEACRKKIDETRQQIRQDHDNLSSASGRNLSAGELMSRSRFIDSLRDREKKEIAAMELQRHRLREAQLILEDRRRDLVKASGDAEAMQKLKETRHAEWKAELEKAQEAEREDDTIQRWNRNS